MTWNGLFAFQSQPRQPLTLLSLHQSNDLHLHLVLVDQHDAQRHRQLEPTRSRTSRIDEQRRTAAFDQRLMRMAGHDHVDTGKLLRNIGYVVDEMNRCIADMKRQRFRQVVDPRARVVVAANRGDGRKFVECVEDSGIADIAGVNDVLGAAQRIERLRAHEVVGIGDDADADDK